MKIGCCGSMINPDGDAIGIESLAMLEKLGYDYIELSLRDVMALSDSDFAVLERRIGASSIRCEACNNFMPNDLRSTGCAADHNAVADYAERAFIRAGALGARVVVFGSPWSRDIEDGFTREATHKQMLALLRRLGPIAERYGIVLAMEHVNRVDGNIYTSVAEMLGLVREVGHPHVGLLLDFFHLSIEKEPLACVVDAGDDLAHIHFAALYKRRFPRSETDNPDYARFFANLKSIQYAHRLSVEATPCSFEEDAAVALAFLRRATR